MFPELSRPVALSRNATRAARRVPVLEQVLLRDPNFPWRAVAAGNWNGTGIWIVWNERQPQRNNGCRRCPDTTLRVIAELILDVVDGVRVVGLVVLEIFTMCGLAKIPSLVPTKYVLHLSIMPKKIPASFSYWFLYTWVCWK